MSTPAAIATTQNVTLPVISELHDPNFLDILLPIPIPVPNPSTRTVTIDDQPKNPMMEALKTTTHHTLTTNKSPAYDSTLSFTLDAFQMLRPHTTGQEIYRSLDKSWKEDPALTLRIIWNSRSIHDGKGDREVFYQAWGWLFGKHPRTAVQNLSMLVEPVCMINKKKQEMAPHGYWKDLLNILCLAALDQLGPLDAPATFLHCPKTLSLERRLLWASRRSGRGRGHARVSTRGIVETEKVRERASADDIKAAVGQKRVAKATHLHENLVTKLSDPRFRALYIMVTCLFAARLSEDVHILEHIEALPVSEERYALERKLSLAAKWAPTPGCTHDRHTNIATAIASLLHTSQSLGTPRVSAAVDEELSVLETHILRSFYQRWVLTPLRKVTHLPEPLMSANRWTEIKYTRVSSLCMQANMEHFFVHDPTGYEKYLVSVETGKKRISGATLMPHEIMKEALSCYSNTPLHPESMTMVERRIADIKARGIEAQWKTMVDRIRESGTLDSALAVCDVSGSMGSIYYGPRNSKFVYPIVPAVSLSLVLAQIAKPPFNNGFITFSANPQFVQLDPTLSLKDTVDAMTRADWGMNTDFDAIFLKLLLPLAIKNNVKQEDMIKRLFVFSDMQFDDSLHNNYASSNAAKSAATWETNHDVVERAYQEAGYEMPEIVYWNLASYVTTSPVTHDLKGVAVMNGFSASMMKVFLGEREEEAEGEEWEKVGDNGETEKVEETKEEEFNPMTVMKRAVMKKSYDGLVVVD